MIAEIIGPTDSRWKAFLAESPHDFYHLPEYLSFSAAHEGGEPIAFYAETAEARFLAPLLLRAVPPVLEAPDGWRDASTPYGYPGPLCAGSADPATLQRLLAALHDTLGAAGAVTAFLRLHPLFPLPLSAAGGSCELVTHGSTVVVDLARSNDEMWSETNAGHRNGINKLRRKGFTVRIDDWSLFPDFLEIYQATMRRVGASDFYLFSDAYFGGLRQALGDKRLHLFAVMSPEGGVAAAGLFTTVCDIVQFHLSGTAPEFMRQAPSKLMLDEARRWAKESGKRWFHLGGGVGGTSDPLFEFKAGFSSLARPFHTCRMILDQEKYALLNQRWARRAGAPAAAGGFFPLYRAPLPSAEVCR